MKFLHLFNSENVPPKQRVLNRIFDTSDPRLQFFDDKLSTEALTALSQLRQYVLEQTRFPTKLTPNSNMLIRAAYSTGNYAQRYHPALEVSLVGVMLETVVLKTLREKSMSFTNPLLRKHNESLSGTMFMGGGAAMSLFMWFTLGQQMAFPMDAQNAHLAKQNIADGLCILKTFHGRYGDYSKYEEVRPGIVCNSGGYTGLLVVTILVMLGFSMLVTMGVRHAIYLRLIDQEFNNTEHDAWLTALCESEGIEETSIDWNREMKIEGRVCTLRTLALIMLTSFDQQAFEYFFKQTLPKLFASELTSLYVSSDRQIQIVPMEEDLINHVTNCM